MFRTPSQLELGLAENQWFDVSSPDDFGKNQRERATLLCLRDKEPQTVQGVPILNILDLLFSCFRSKKFDFVCRIIGSS
jgi:hypothetical protein